LPIDDSELQLSLSSGCFGDVEYKRRLTERQTHVTTKHYNGNVSSFLCELVVCPYWVRVGLQNSCRQSVL